MKSIIDAYASSSDDEETNSADVVTEKMKENITKALNYDSTEACLRLSLAPINPEAESYVKNT